MFTIAHLSDLHLGYSSGRKRLDENGYNVRENDGYVAYNKAIDQIIEEKVDIVLIAGDFFHSPRPKNHTILEAQEGLRRLSLAGIETYILAGNHDATDIVAEIPSSRLMNEPGSGIFSYSEPYIVKEVAPQIFIHFISHHGYTCQEDTMNQIKLKDGAVNILATHGSCYDTNMGLILRTPNEPREVIIPENIINMPWDYTLLGHIHERGWIGSEDGLNDTGNRKQFYNGSLLRRGFSDKPSKLGRGWTKWIINDSGEFSCEMFTIPEREQFDMPPIDMKNKKTEDVEEEIILQLKEINSTMTTKYGEININNAPIVRQTINGVNAVTRLSLNLQRFTPYTQELLSHNFKIIPSNEDGKVKMDQVNVEALSTGDIVTVFKEWNRTNNDKLIVESDIKTDVLNTANKYLAESRDALLTED